MGVGSWIGGMAMLAFPATSILPSVSLQETGFMMAPVEPETDIQLLLPRSRVWRFKRGDRIFDHGLGAALWLVIEGQVKLERHAPNGRRVLVDIYKADELFGELLLEGQQIDNALAVSKTVKCMGWPADQIQLLCDQRPALSSALMHLALKRNAQYLSRVESLTADRMGRRIAQALVFFVDRMANDERTLEVLALTHEAIADYVGATRANATKYLTHFRRLGLIDYNLGSRGRIDVKPELRMALKVQDLRLEISIRK
jgi:CRP/FNR family transcriptional regulator, cyclic AMP receptor protein